MSAATGLPSLPFARRSRLQPAEDLARFRAKSPVARVLATTGEPAWLVTRYEEARTVLADPRFTLAVPGMGADAEAANDSLFQDPPGHTRLRRLVAAAFTSRRVAGLRPRIAEVAATLIDQMTAREPPVDLMESLGIPLPITVIGDLLGIPVTDRDAFRECSDTMLSMPAAAGHDRGAAWERLSAQVGALIARKRADPDNDLLSALIAVRDADAGCLSESELVMMAVSLIPAGYLTTAMATAIGTILLTAHGQLGRLDEPARVPGAVEEILRYQAVGGDVARIATDGIRLANAEIAAGEKVLVSLTSANRDERRFDDPDRFDIERVNNAHLTFGHGIHHCLGAALARAELQAVFATLAARLPSLHLAVTPDELIWSRSELFGDEWPQSLLVSW